MFQKQRSATELITSFEEKMKSFASHLYRVVHQCRQIRMVKSEIQPNELVLHVDFSENYTAKYGREVQMAHFGHRHQVVIHQGVCYMSGKSPQSFVTLSDDNRKTAEAVTAHLNSYLTFLDTSFTKV